MPLRLRRTIRPSPKPALGGDESRGLISALRSTRRRLWLARTAVIGLRLVLIALTIAFLIGLARFIGLREASDALGPLVALTVAFGIGIVGLQRVSDADAARFLDRNLGLRARLSTAVQLMNSDGLKSDGQSDGQSDGPKSDGSGKLARAQLAEAAATLGRTNARSALRVPFPGAELRRIGVALVGTVLVFALASNTSSGNGLGVAGAVPDDASAARASESWYEVTTGPDSNLPAQATDEALTGELASLKRDLESGKLTPEEYANRVAAVEGALRDRAAESVRQQQSLANLADSLKDSSSTRGISDSLNRGDYASAVQQTSALANQTENLSAQAKSEIAQRLNDASAKTAGTSPALSSAAKDAANALQQGDNGAAKSAISELASQMAQSGQSVLPQADLAKAMQEAQSQIAQDKSGDGSGQATSSQDSAAAGMADSTAQAGGKSQSSDPTKPQNADGSGSGGGAGNGGGERTVVRDPAQADQSGKSNVLRIDGTATQLGQTKRSDSADTPLTTTSSGVASVKSTGAFQRSTEPVSTVGEKNYVPYDIKPVVKDYFSGTNGQAAGQ